MKYPLIVSQPTFVRVCPTEAGKLVAACAERRDALATALDEAGVDLPTFLSPVASMYTMREIREYASGFIQGRSKSLESAVTDIKKRLQNSSLEWQLPQCRFSKSKLGEIVVEPGWEG